jgi:NADH-quinone oxidoreductase subunit A
MFTRAVSRRPSASERLGAPAGLICQALIIPMFAPAAPNTVSRTNNLDGIYFIDPPAFCVEVRHHDHDLFSAEQRCLSMDDVLSGDLIYVFAYCLGGLAFAVGPFVVVLLLEARKTRNYAHKTEQFIECGMDPIGDAWIRYSAVYYLYALVFVAFAVDVLFLIPVALVYNRIEEFVIRDFVELLLFVGILSLVIVYAWKKGVFEWKRRKIVPKP